MHSASPHQNPRSQRVERTNHATIFLLSSYWVRRFFITYLLSFLHQFQLKFRRFYLIAPGELGFFLTEVFSALFTQQQLTAPNTNICLSELAPQRGGNCHKGARTPAYGTPILLGSPSSFATSNSMCNRSPKHYMRTNKVPSVST